jgi:hypothetical protein
VDGFVEVSPLLQPAANPIIAASPSVAHLLFMLSPIFIEIEVINVMPRYPLGFAASNTLHTIISHTG